MSALVDDLARLAPRALAARFAAGRPVAVAALAGRRFLGRSLGQPRLVERLTWQTFRKDVDVAGPDGVIRGENVRVPQPWHRPGRGEQRVMPFVLREDDDGAALIDYRATHPPLHPLGRAVDPLRRVDEGTGPMVLLGVTELCVGRRRLRTPTWFALMPEPDT